jgi:hypothetical protein
VCTSAENPLPRRLAQALVSVASSRANLHMQQLQSAVSAVACPQHPSGMSVSTAHSNLALTA